MVVPSRVVFPAENIYVCYSRQSQSYSDHWFQQTIKIANTFERRYLINTVNIYYHKKLPFDIPAHRVFFSKYSQESCKYCHLNNVTVLVSHNRISYLSGVSKYSKEQTWTTPCFLGNTTLNCLADDSKQCNFYFSCISVLGKKFSLEYLRNLKGLLRFTYKMAAVISWTIPRHFTTQFTCNSS